MNRILIVSFEQSTEKNLDFYLAVDSAYYLAIANFYVLYAR